MDILFTNAIEGLKNAKILIIGTFENFELSGRVSILEQSSNNFLSKVLKANNFKGKSGETVTIHTPELLDNHNHIIKVIFFGLGKQSEFNDLNAEKAGSKLLNILKKLNIEECSILLENIKEDYIPYIALGLSLKNYSFKKYKTKLEEKDKTTIIKKVNFIAENSDYVQNIFTNKIEPLIRGIWLARDLVTEPANELTPESYALIIKDVSREFSDLKVEILDEKMMQKLGMHALLGVGQGSQYRSRLAVLKWNGGSKDEAPIALVGKGVTFDTGGISLKPAKGMWEMIYDMAGSASVVGTLYTLAARKAKVNVVGVVGLVENAISGTAQRPGDIVKSMSGQTIEVLNTDAEGRLVLADALWYAQEYFQPKLIIDLATLTGAIVTALGSNCYAGLFSNNDNLVEKLISSGKNVDEKLWRFPLAQEYDDQMNSDVADMKNISLKGSGADSITAAEFLQRFLKDKTIPWAHLDIAGMAWAKEELTSTPRGATGFGVKLLNQFIAEHFEPSTV